MKQDAPWLVTRFAICVAMIGSPTHASDRDGQPDTSRQSFVQWARSQAVHLPGVDSPEAMNGDALGRMIGTARVVALGEPAHGAHEPLSLRNRLFRYLVEQLGFTAIALESGLGESRRLYDFALGGEGNVQEITRQGLTYGFGNYAENVELLSWIRQYNDDPAHARKVRVYGIDLTGADGAGGFESAHISLDDALGYLQRFARDPHERIHSAIAPYVRKLARTQYLALSLEEREHLAAALDNLVALYERERASLIAAATEDEYEWAYRSAIVARQIEQFLRLLPAHTPSGGVIPGFHDAAVARDAAMAANVLWVLEREGREGGVMIFAHNAHIVNAPLRGGIWAAYARAPTMMGQHLRKALGKRLFIAATSSARNGPGLRGSTQDPGSLDTALEAVGFSHFLLDLRDVRRPEPPVTAWLGREQSMRANFTTEIVLPPVDAMDAVVFIDCMSSARRVP